jgi:hypothetical protein
MTWDWTYWLWTSGTFTASVTLALDPSQNYVVTGYLTQTNGGDYAHVYIAMVCTISGDQQLCGVRDDGGDGSLNIVEALPSGASSVTINLKTTGGNHRAEGVIWQL